MQSQQAIPIWDTQTVYIEAAVIYLQDACNVRSVRNIHPMSLQPNHLSYPTAYHKTCYIYGTIPTSQLTAQSHEWLGWKRLHNLWASGNTDGLLECTEWRLVYIIFVLQWSMQINELKMLNGSMVVIAHCYVKKGQPMTSRLQICYITGSTSRYMRKGWALWRGLRLKSSAPHSGQIPTLTIKRGLLYLLQI